MRLDTSLSFRPFISTIRDKMEKRINVMRALAGRSFGTGDRVLCMFDSSAVRACVEYAAPCLLLVPISRLTPLETTQNKALRVILGAPRWTKCIAMRAKTSMCRVLERVSQLVGGLDTRSLLRQPVASHLMEKVRRNLHHDPRLFRRRTWHKAV